MVDGQIRQRAADKSFEIVISNERFGDDGALTVTINSSLYGNPVTPEDKISAEMERSIGAWLLSSSIWCCFQGGKCLYSGLIDWYDSWVEPPKGEENYNVEIGTTFLVSISNFASLVLHRSLITPSNLRARDQLLHVG